MQGGLQIQESPKYEASFYYVQRIGWCVMLLIIAAAVAGFFGIGPVARADARADGIHLDYPRFGRMSTTSTLELTVEPPHASDRVMVWISGDYLRRFQLEDVLPEPTSAIASGDRIVYSFAADPSKPLRVTLRLTLEEGTFGTICGQIGTSAGSLEFWQFFWP